MLSFLSLQICQQLLYHFKGKQVKHAFDMHIYKTFAVQLRVESGPVRSGILHLICTGHVQITLLPAQGRPEFSASCSASFTFQHLMEQFPWISL